MKLVFDSIQQEIFEKLDGNRALDLDLECEIEAGGVEKKQNILRKDFDQENRFNISGKLFAPASQVFVTR